jgi:hypothetical protein
MDTVTEQLNQLGEWMTAGFEWVVNGTAWLLGAVAGGVVILIAIVAVIFVGAVMIETRRHHDTRRAAAYREWCERTGWCPTHHVADGDCPRVEQHDPYGPGPAHLFVECPGSGALR